MNTQEQSKPPRQWLDVIALAIALASFLWGAFLFYFSDVRITDNLNAIVLAVTPELDTNQIPIISADLVFRNEGNRAAIIHRISLTLSETPEFELPVSYYWDKEVPLFIETKSTALELLRFGKGYTNNPIIIPRGHHDPPIYAAITYDVIDSGGRLHRKNVPLGILQYRDGLNFFWTNSPPPWQTTLLPSTLPPPYIVTGTIRDRSRECLIPIMRPVTNDGPLGIRFIGANTNDVYGPWPVKQIPIKGMAWRYVN